MSLPWPELSSTRRPEETIRQILDYLCWIADQMRQVGFHGEADREAWRIRVQRAYGALFLPPVHGHGDPYPPDIPPAENPGIWPDVPAAAIPGMTLRHQLKVIALLAEDLRDRIWVHSRPSEVDEWDRRLALAREALDHGEALPLPEEARTQPSEQALAEARAQEAAFKEHARKRALRLQRLKAEAKRARKKSKAGRGAKKKAKATARPKAKAKAKAKAKPKAKAKAKRVVKKKPAAKAKAKKVARPKTKAKAKKAAKKKGRPTRGKGSR